MQPCLDFEGKTDDGKTEVLLKNEKKFNYAYYTLAGL